MDKRQAQRHPLRGDRGVPGARPCSRSTSRPAAPTRSGCTSPPLRHPCAGDLTYGADPTLAARLGLERQWLHAVGLGFEHPGIGRVGHLREPLPAGPAQRARPPLSAASPARPGMPRAGLAVVRHGSRHAGGCPRADLGWSAMSSRTPLDVPPDRLRRRASSDSFVHLHVHTEYSMLDGAARIGDLFTQAAEMGMPALATTDHGYVFGAYEFWKKAQGTGVKPIIGVEAYVTPGHPPHRQDPGQVGRRAHQPGDDVSGSGAYTHMTLLARNNNGLHNLFRMDSPGLPRPGLRQVAADRPRAARPLRPGPDRHHRLPVGRGPDPAAARASTTRRCRRPPTSATSSARRTTSAS